MRLCVTVFALFLAIVSIYYQNTVGGQSETQIKNPQPNQAALSAPIHQPETIAKQDDAYDPRHDCLYRAYLAFTIIGVFVAMGAIIVFYLQTKATQDSARAALLNAQAVINSQRSWIAVRTKDPPIAGSVEFQAECLVGIPAKMIHNYAKWKAVAEGQSLQPIYDTEMLQYPFLIAPSDGKKRVFEFGIESLQANTPLWNDIQNLQQTLYFFGKIEYTDGVSIDDKGNPIVHETKWCYQYIGGAIVRSGPPGMNDCT
jgi:hypothetical protein